MPKKSRRVASRQSQLSGRAKRVHAHGPTGIPTGTPQHPTVEPRTSTWAPGEAETIPDSSPRELPTVAATGTTPNPSYRTRGATVQVKPAETYFIPELRRIGLASVMVFALLFALIFLLR